MMFQEALRLLYNIKQFNEEMVEEGLDINKMPLGELDSETITKGYKVCQDPLPLFLGTLGN